MDQDRAPLHEALEAMRSRKLVIDEGTWRCVRGTAARFVMRG